MKYFVTTAVAALSLAAVSAPAIAEDPPATKGPPVTMGDQGKLPATGTMTDKVPDMTGPGTAATGASSGTSGSASPKGPPQTMGDEPGKLPATGTVSGAVPEMRGPDPTEEVGDSGRSNFLPQKCGARSEGNASPWRVPSGDRAALCSNFSSPSTTASRRHNSRGRDMANTSILASSEASGTSWWGALLLGVLLVLAGLFVLGDVALATVISAILFGIVLLVAGAAEIFQAFSAPHWRGFLLQTSHRRRSTPFAG